MTEDQKRDAFMAYVQQRENRQATNKVKNEARNSIQKQYADEYKELFEAALKKVKAVKLSEQDEAKILKNAMEKKRKSQAKNTARKQLLETHEDEYKALRGKD